MALQLVTTEQRQGQEQERERERKVVLAIGLETRENNNDANGMENAAEQATGIYRCGGWSSGFE